MGSWSAPSRSPIPVTWWASSPGPGRWPGSAAARASWAGVKWPGSRCPAGQDRFTAADKWLRALLDGAQVEDRVGAPGCGPVAFGSFTFDPTSEGSVLILPQVMLGRRAGQAWLTSISGQPPAPPAAARPAGRSQAGPAPRDASRPPLA